MGVSIRLRRLGSSQKPCYRVVACESQRATQGKPIEELGIYAPLAKDQPLRIDTARLEAWRTRGATNSPSVARLLKRAAEFQKTE